MMPDCATMLGGCQHIGMHLEAKTHQMLYRSGVDTEP